ncbi:hypothetical protein FKM82_004218 [Ascaphus truei]
MHWFYITTICNKMGITNNVNDLAGNVQYFTKFDRTFTILLYYYTYCNTKIDLHPDRSKTRKHRCLEKAPAPLQERDYLESE